MKVKNLIIGSGAGGLGAAVWLKHFGRSFTVFDSAKELPSNLHNGVHYLHSEPVLPFDTEIKRITLTDGILDGGRIHHQPNLEFSLKYSEKVREIQHPSSIMEIGKHSSVFMPKSNTMNTLLTKCYDFAGRGNFYYGNFLKEIDSEKRIARFDYKETTFEVGYENLISTVPLDKMRMMMPNGIPASLSLKYSPIYIANYKIEKIVPNWLINVYIPDERTPVYRASILNGICSVESIRELNEHELHSVKDLLNAFHLTDDPAEKFTWKTGKVISISVDDRQMVENELKMKGIYLVGRFATWNRKLLVDSTIAQAKLIVETIM